MSTPRTFIVFTADRKQFTVEAVSLRTAVRNCGVKEEAILGVVDQSCAPQFQENGPPFIAVLLRNPRYAAPATEG